MTTVTGEIWIDASRQTVSGILANSGASDVRNPAAIDSFYPLYAEGGVGASGRHDLPEDGHVIERAFAWKPVEGHTLGVEEGTGPFQDVHAVYILEDDGQGTAVTLTLEYESNPDAPVGSRKTEHYYREELCPAILTALKHYIETGQSTPVLVPDDREVVT